MDLATIVGFVAGIGFIVWGIGFGNIAEFINFPSILITVGGTIAATAVSYPLPKLKELIRVTTVVFKTKEEDPGQLIEALVGYAVRARHEGLLALESEAEGAGDPFLSKGLGLLVDGTDPTLVRSILETDISFLEERHKASAQIFETMALYAPAFGMVGTLIGLIQMLGKLDDPGAIGPALAVALLTTLYGAVMANLVFLPIAGKLKVRSSEEILRKEVMIEGILAIQAGEGSAVITARLNSFLSPKLRAQKGHVGREE